jgi:hypothetical protein
VDHQDALTSTLQARIAAHRGDWEAAKGFLEPVTGPRAPRYSGRNQLSHWTLAEAEEALGNLAASANLFAGVANGDHFGYHESQALGLTYSFAHRNAALLYGQLGDRDRAVEHWRAFLDAFTQPDPDFEWMVEEGRTELERLEG